MLKLLKKSYVLKLFVLLCLIKGTLWAVVFPIFQAPDEEAHFSYVQYWVENKELPSKAHSDENGMSKQLENTLQQLEFYELRFNPFFEQTFSEESLDGFNEQEITDSNWNPRGNQSYLAYAYPPFYYAMLWPAYLIFEGDILAQAMAMRMTSVLLSLIMVGLIYGAAKSYFRDEFWAYCVTTIIIFQPMFSYMSAVINNDVLMNIAYVGFYWSSLKMIKTNKPLTLKQGGILMAWSILGIFSKTQGYGLIGLAILLWAWKADWREKWKSESVIAGGSAVILLGIIRKLFIKDWQVKIEAYSQFFKDDPLRNISRFLGDLWRYGFETFWGRFGWLDTSLWPVAIVILKGIVFLSILGLLRVMTENWQKDKVTKFLMASTMIIGAAYIFYFVDSNFIADGAVTYQLIQGRYFFILILPLFFLGIKGFMRWIPRKHQKLVLLGLTFGMVCFNIVTLINIIIPRYYL